MQKRPLTQGFCFQNPVLFSLNSLEWISFRTYNVNMQGLFLLIRLRAADKEWYLLPANAKLPNPMPACLE
jgi:hypothetical protein